MVLVGTGLTNSSSVRAMREILGLRLLWLEEGALLDLCIEWALKFF